MRKRAGESWWKHRYIRFAKCAGVEQREPDRGLACAGRNGGSAMNLRRRTFRVKKNTPWDGMCSDSTRTGVHVNDNHIPDASSHLPANFSTAQRASAWAVQAIRRPGHGRVRGHARGVDGVTAVP